MFDVEHKISSVILRIHGAHKSCEKPCFAMQYVCFNQTSSAVVWNREDSNGKLCNQIQWGSYIMPLHVEMMKLYMYV